jgi:hypothetical protein
LKGTGDAKVENPEIEDLVVRWAETYWLCRFLVFFMAKRGKCGIFGHG